MAILKYWNGATWYPLYMDVFNKCLHKNNNLGDLTDLVAARTNLELTGNNVTTHLHDSRYLPLMDTETQERMAADTVEQNARAAGDNALDAKIAALQTQVNSLQTQLTALHNSIVISATAPENPIADVTIWLDTTNRLIKIYHGGAWMPMSAVWL